MIVKRDEFFSKGQWWYDPKRGIARNHQNPSNYSEKYRSANHLEESAKWKIGVGPRLSAINATAAMMSSKIPETSSSTIRPSKERRKVAAENQKARVQKDNDAITAGFKQSGVGQKRKARDSSVNIKPPSPQLSSKLQKASSSTSTIVDSAIKTSSAPRSHAQTASFAEVRYQIVPDSDIAELQMRERSRLQLVEIELARQEQRVL